MMRVVLSIFVEATRAFARGESHAMENLLLVICEATRAFVRGESNEIWRRL